MDYINTDYVMATVWFVLAASLSRLAWRAWKLGDRGDAAMNGCLAFLLLILAVLQFKKGVGA